MTAAPPPPLIVARSGADQERARGFIGSVRAAWPGDPPPIISTVDLADFERQIAGRDDGAAEASDVYLLLDPGPGDHSGAARRVVDHLRLSGAAAVVIADPSRTDLIASAGGELAVCDPGRPAHAAAMAYALALRQGAIDLLRRDLRLATRLQSGVRAEVDRLHDEMHLAALIQRECLPRALPDAEGMRFGVLFRPAGYVSGDIYDLSALDERHVGFFIADAVGHGVPAALLTTLISRGLRLSECPDGCRRLVPPGEALARLNEELVAAQAGRARFATAVCGVVDCQTGGVTLAVAGHPAPLIVGRGAVEAVAAEGPLLGVFGGAVFEEARVSLSRGRTLLLHSDGFETAFPDAGAQGDTLRRGTKNYLARLAGLPWPAEDGLDPQAALSELERALDEQAGSLHQVDDVTALAISWHGAAESRLAA